MPTLLKNLKIATIGSVDRPANQKALAVLFKRADTPMKTEGGVEFPAAAYAYTPDKSKPSEWKLRLWESPEAKETAKQVGMAVAAIGPGFRGQKVQIPEADLPGVKAKVRAAWKKVNPDKSADEMPPIIKSANVPDEATLKEKLFGFAKGLFGSGDGSGQAQDLNSILADQETDELLWDLTRALRESLDSILDDDTLTDKQTAIAQSLQQFFSALVGTGVVKAGKKIAASRLDMLKQMQTMLSQLITEAEAAPGGVSKQRGNEQVPITEEVRKGLSEEVQQYLADIEKQAGQVDGLAAKVAELEKKENLDGGQEDIWKGVNPEVRKRLEDAEKRARDAEELAKSEKEKRENQEFMKRAEQFPHIGKAEVVADMLKKAYAVSDEYGRQLEETFKASNEQVEKGMLFGEFGRSGGASGGGDAVAKAEAMAAEMVQKNSGMTKEQALAKVWAENPDLYAEYEREQNAYRRDR